MRLSNPSLLTTAVLALSIGLLVGCAKPKESTSPATATVTVYKSPSCSCCGTWIDHMKQNGFAVEVKDMPDVMPVKKRLGVPSHLTSCHTAVVDGFVMEGHVPADEIRRLLAERPDIRGLAVAGMPAGSPGMESLIPQAYDVIAFDDRGGQGVFASK